MSSRKAKPKERKGSGPLLSSLKWLGAALVTASLWALIATDNIGDDALSAVIVASFLTLVIALRLLYLINLARISRSGSNALIDELDGVEFEHFSADVLKRNGFSKVRVTKSSGDFGADITAKDQNGCLWVFQCKRYGSNVGNSPIQEVAAAKLHYNAQYAGVITNRHFTPAARQLAEENDVLLIEREKLFRLNKKPSKRFCRDLCKRNAPPPTSEKVKTGGIIITCDSLDD